MEEWQVENPGWMQVYLSAQNTLVIDAEGRSWNNVDGKKRSTNDTVMQAWEDGYDCVVIKNVVDGGSVGQWVDDEFGNEYYEQLPFDEVIVKDSAQVKSVYNTGSFSAQNPDVRYSIDTSKPFHEQVDTALSEPTSENRFTALYVEETPNLLAEVGLGDLPLVMTVRHLKNIVHEKNPEHTEWHGVPLDVVDRLGELLSNAALLQIGARHRPRPCIRGPG